MRMSWPSVPLGDVLRHRKQFITIDDMTDYQRCRVQLHAAGVVLRDVVPGSTINTKSQQVCRAGEFLVAEIDAKMGGYGVVPAHLHGAIVSSHYFLFEVLEERLDRGFLGWYCKTPAFREQVRAQGTTNYAAIRPGHVLGYTIPLPPLAEQRRIVARLDALATKVAGARGLCEEVNRMSTALTYGAMKAARKCIMTSGHKATLLGNVTRVTSGGTPDRSNPAYWDGNIPWVKTGELLDGDIAASEEHISAAAVANSSARVFPPDTVLVALYGQGQTRGRTGRLLISAATNQACAAVLPVPSVLDPKFVQFWLRSLYVDMRADSHGGAQPNWSGGMIKNIVIAVPPLDVQRQTVAHLEDQLERIAEAGDQQGVVERELIALLPSLINRAFAGTL